MNERDIELASDLDGTELVIVPLGSKDDTCTIERADYDYLIKSGVSPRWALSNGRYVTAMKGGKREYVARLICVCGERQFLSYRDDNPMNLRRTNLALMEKLEVPVTFAREAA